MPRPEEAPASKPSLLQRVLKFFGIGKKARPGKDDKRSDKRKDAKRPAPPQKVRIAKTNNRNGSPAAKGGRRITSTPPTRNARLYVGNLSYEATESELEDLFKGFGNVRSVEIIYNPHTYKSKGYAFVEMCQLEDARKATEVLHGQPFMGRELMVSAASEKPEAASDSPQGREAQPAQSQEQQPQEQDKACQAPAAESAAPAAQPSEPAEA